MTTENVITLAGIVFASAGLWTFLGKIYDNHKHKKTPQERMLLALVRDKLCSLSKSYILRGYIPEDELEVFYELGNSYIENGGNSAVKTLFLQAQKLPTRIDRE